jgi:hypothetical protein
MEIGACYINHEDRQTLEDQLLTQEWINKLPKAFSKGGKFVPIVGDGNCFFSAVSTYITSTKEEPFGTANKHSELRKKACDHIEKNIGREPYKSVMLKWGVKDTKAYVKRKRSTEGQTSSWSDTCTMRAMQDILGRPIKQITFPIYQNRKPQPQLGPRIFNMTNSGCTGEPILIHYNGINHYNAIVPL